MWHLRGYIYSIEIFSGHCVRTLYSGSTMGGTKTFRGHSVWYCIQEALFVAVIFLKPIHSALRYSGDTVYIYQAHKYFSGGSMCGPVSSLN